jgi:hypothetical protein
MTESLEHIKVADSKETGKKEKAWTCQKNKEANLKKILVPKLK